MPYKDPVKRREYANRISLEWAKKNPEKMKRFWREYYYRNKAKQQANHKDWLARNPDYLPTYNKKHYEKYSARIAVNNAVNTGKLVKPNCCSRCNQSKKLQAHHHLGYTKEHRLSVVWLCIPCHEKAHHS